MSHPFSLDAGLGSDLSSYVFQPHLMHGDESHAHAHPLLPQLRLQQQQSQSSAEPHSPYRSHSPSGGDEHKESEGGQESSRPHMDFSFHPGAQGSQLHSPVHAPMPSPHIRSHSHSREQHAEHATDEVREQQQQQAQQTSSASAVPPLQPFGSAAPLLANALALLMQQQQQQNQLSPFGLNVAQMQLMLGLQQQQQQQQGLAALALQQALGWTQPWQMQQQLQQAVQLSHQTPPPSPAPTLAQVSNAAASAHQAPSSRPPARNARASGAARHAQAAPAHATNASSSSSGATSSRVLPASFNSSASAASHAAAAASMPASAALSASTTPSLSSFAAPLPLGLDSSNQSQILTLLTRSQRGVRELSAQADLMRKLPKDRQAQVVQSLTPRERARLAGVLSRKSGGENNASVAAGIGTHFDDDPHDAFHAVPPALLQRAAVIAQEEAADARSHTGSSRRRKPAFAPVPFAADGSAVAGSLGAVGECVSLEDSRHPRTYFLPVIQRMMLAFGDVHMRSDSGPAAAASSSSSSTDLPPSTLAWPSLYSAMRIQEYLETWLHAVLSALPGRHQKLALLRLFPQQGRIFLRCFTDRSKANTATAAVESEAAQALDDSVGDELALEDDFMQLSGSSLPHGARGSAGKRSHGAEPMSHSKRRRGGSEGGTGSKAAAVAARSSRARRPPRGAAAADDSDAEHSVQAYSDVSASGTEDDETSLGGGSEDEAVSPLAAGLDIMSELGETPVDADAYVDGEEQDEHAEDEEGADSAELEELLTSADATATGGASPQTQRRKEGDIYFPALDLHLGSSARLRRQSVLSQQLSAGDYSIYLKCREASFCRPAPRADILHRWLRLHEFALAKNALQLLCFIAWDRVGMIVEVCAALRECSRHARSPLPFTVYEVDAAINWLESHPHTTQRHLREPHTLQHMLHKHGNAQGQTQTSGSRKPAQPKRDAKTSVLSAGVGLSDEPSPGADASPSDFLHAGVCGADSSALDAALGGVSMASLLSSSSSSPQQTADMAHHEPVDEQERAADAQQPAQLQAVAQQQLASVPPPPPAPSPAVLWGLSMLPPFAAHLAVPAIPCVPSPVPSSAPPKQTRFSPALTARLQAVANACAWRYSAAHPAVVALLREQAMPGAEPIGAKQVAAWIKNHRARRQVQLDREDQ